MRSSRGDVPEGFDATYPCKIHPERDAVAPIALRWCAECLEIARLGYATQVDMRGPWRPEHDMSTDGRPLIERKFERRAQDIIKKRSSAK